MAGGKGKMSGTGWHIQYPNYRRKKEDIVLDEFKAKKIKIKKCTIQISDFIDDKGTIDCKCLYEVLKRPKKLKGVNNYRQLADFLTRYKETSSLDSCDITYLNLSIDKLLTKCENVERQSKNKCVSTKK